jgi:hypothetical protein
MTAACEAPPAGPQRHIVVASLVSRSPFIGSRRVHVGVAIVCMLAAAHIPAAVADLAAPRKISIDPFVDAPGQHETAVEPDSYSFGDVVVTAFQVGRIESGGAAGIGWATSKDGGRTWTSGVLPALTRYGEPRGALIFAGDPVVAYDHTHRVWLISMVGVRGFLPDGRPAISLLVSRSGDGLNWGTPITAVRERDDFGHDKEWIACDNGTASPFAGRCYLVWTAAVGTNGSPIGFAVASSDDGGVTWTTPLLLDRAVGIGAQPLIRPDGTLVVVFQGFGMEAIRSADGGQTFSPPARIAAEISARVPGMRAPPFPSAEVDRSGRIFVAWQDCRYRPVACRSNDIVLASSTDGIRWTRAKRVPMGSTLDGLVHFTPGLAVDASTEGAARLALAFYVLTPRRCDRRCGLETYFVSSSDAGTTWSTPEQLGGPMPLDAHPISDAGFFVGDYISTSFVSGGVSVPVFAAALAPFDGRYHQGVLATAIPPLAAATQPLRLGRPTITPQVPRKGGTLSVSAPMTGAQRGATAVCAARTERARLRLIRRIAAAARVRCRWHVPGAASGRGAGSIGVTTPEADTRRAFSFRVR